MSDFIKREDAIMALRLEYPMMPFFKESREEWAIKTEGYRKAEEVIMKLPSVDTPTTMTGVIDAIREAEYRGYMKAVEERPKGEWIPNSPFTGNCSECGADGNLKDNYCSNCGARMFAKDINVPNKKGADDGADNI